METMTSRERMLAAINNQVPDRVPVAPDISNMIPCRLTGKPFWEVYYFGEPSLWEAYVDAIRYFGIDGWFIDGSMRYRWPGDRAEAVEDVQKSDERWTVTYRGRLAGKHYTRATTFYVADSPTPTGKPLRDLERDWPLIEAWFAPPTGYDPAFLRRQREVLGESGAFGVSLSYPGLHSWLDLFQGELLDLSTWYFFQHDRILALRDLHEAQVLKQMEMVLDEKPDFVLLGGSGTLTLQSPTIARELTLPSIQKLTRLARQAGVPTMLHSCGKERLLVQWCAEETDLNCINPLEVAPMGDCDLAEIKRAYGDRLALMGNLHTTEVMLMGSPDDVEQAACEAIRAAGQGGGFILSTGDQCGRDTPDENIFRLVDAAKAYGTY
jgi:uroporphyrinogen decarboxylase